VATAATHAESVGVLGIRYRLYSGQPSNGTMWSNEWSGAKRSTLPVVRLHNVVLPFASRAIE
jgi:hypothetical protein